MYRTYILLPCTIMHVPYACFVTLHYYAFRIPYNCFYLALKISHYVHFVSLNFTSCTLIIYFVTLHYINARTLLIIVLPCTAFHVPYVYIFTLHEKYTHIPYILFSHTVCIFCTNIVDMCMSLIKTFLHCIIFFYFIVFKV